MPIINGRRVNIPSSGVYGKELIDAVKPEPGRRTILQNGLEAEQINPQKKYNPKDLIDKRGRPVKISTIPDRTKGSFGGTRSILSKHIITEQVFDLAEHCFKQGIDFDEDNADWMVVPKYVLPKIWHHIDTTSSLLIVFPTEYPELPPIGFYLKAALVLSANGHFYEQAYHEAYKEPLRKDWKWYCVYIPSGYWKPARVRESGDWKKGDNLWTYFTLIKEVLGSTGD